MATFLEFADVAFRLRNLRLIARRRTALHDIELYAHPELGNVLVLDREIHHVEAWQATYHEPLVHLPISFIPTIRTALILGGGDLFAAREVLKYGSVQSVRLVEHDRAVIDLMRDHYSHAAAVLCDPRLKLMIADAHTELSRDQRHYDLIVNDWIDLSQSAAKNGLSIYQKEEQLLSAQGVCTDVLYRHVFEKSGMRRALRKLADASHLVLSLVTVPEYPGVLHIQALWGGNPDLKQESKIIKNRVQRRALRASGEVLWEYFDPRYRSFFLYLPPYVKRAIAV